MSRKRHRISTMEFSGLPNAYVLAAGLAACILAAVSCRPGGVGRNEVLLTGPIECMTTELGFQTMGRIAAVLVDEGQQIQKGETLATLDATELTQREQSARTEVLSAEAAVESARAQLAQVARGARAQEIEQARQGLAAAQSRLDNAAVELNRTRELYNAGSQPKKVLDSAETAYRLAEAEQKKAAEALALLKEGPRPEEIKVAEARVREAEAHLEQARQSHLLAQTQSGYGKLVSPITGRVISRDAGVGEVVNVGTKVVTVADLDDIWFRAYVDESLVDRIKVGQAVEVVCESLKGRKYTGTIEFITFPTRTEQAKRIYRVKVRVKNENEELRPGMTVSARLQLS
ncbi:MAG: efflux RND transporter periplasmic adaptor subunit [Acidobacteriota bacterium]